MKTLLQPKFVFVFGFWLSGITLQGHDVPVHWAITFNAQESAHDNSPAYASFLGAVSSDIAFIDATNAMVKGAGFEDNQLNQDHIGGYRSLNHFYDPTKNPPRGLTDRGWPLSPASIGRDSFTWATISHSPAVDSSIESGKYNIWSWQNARNYEWLGLTAASQSERQTNLANMFRSVGQVMHLLEDNSQPQHARNEAHLDQIPYLGIDLWSRSVIEDYYKKHQLNYQHDMQDWRGDGFTKLADFWNRDFLRIGGRTALNNDLSGGTYTLGLAEFCNGNFVGQRAVYGEFVSDHNDIHYFAFPSLADTTQPNLQEGNLWGTATHGDVTLENFKHGTRLYISKTNAGVTVTYHSVLSYLIAEHPGKASGIPTLLISDDNVLQEYHALLIPKAVKYCAGLLDYFFRGRLKVCVSPASPDLAGLYIENKSGTNLYRGSFTLFSEDNAGTRTRILTTNLSDVIGSGDSLDDGVFVSMNFTPPLENPAAYVVVYQGTIGADDSGPLDPVDAGVAIAALRVVSCYPDSEGPTPNTLEYPDPADLGEVTVPGVSQLDTNRISFGSFGPGEYQINYVEGTYTYPNGACWTVDRCPTCPYPYGTVAWFFPYADGSLKQSEAFPGANYWEGQYTSEEAEAITSAMNPELEFFQLVTGPISLKLGAGISYGSAYGAVTYQLRRVGSFYHQPTRIRIRNYASEVQPLLTVCSNCIDAATEAQWDGSFNYRELSMPSSASWYPDDTFDYLAVNGKVVDFITVLYTSIYREDFGGYVRCWNIAIWGATSGYDDVLVWNGYKFTGTSPVGTYFKDANTPMCVDGLCCLDIENY